MAYLTPIILDDWYQVGWLREHELTPGSVAERARWNYLHYNPRLGETFLLLVNGPWPFRVLLTPLIELLLLWVVFALAFGRWPRPSARDAGWLVVLQALLWAASPAPGLLWFYRPFTTNYLYGVALHLLVVVPYRFALVPVGGGSVRARVWWAPAIFVGGVAAGWSNEHTGPATIVAAIALSVTLVRRGVRRVWMAAGIAGLALGWAALYLAPGQSQRYGGTGATESRAASLAGRGLEGAYDVVAQTVLHAQAGVVLGLAVIAIAVSRAARRGTSIAGPSRDATFGIAGLIAWAGAIVVTLWASPRLGERLYLAPAVLLVVALAVAMDAALAADRVLRRAVVAVAAVIVVAHGAIFLRAQIGAHADASDRFARLERAADGTVAVVPPFRAPGRSRWFWGDDFTYASLREYVAHEVFGLAGIELEGAPGWAEPTPPFRFEVVYTFEPPLDRAALAARVTLPDYTPTYWEWALAQQRRLEPALRAIDGHRLRAIDVRVTGVDAAIGAVLRGRPLFADRWADGTWRFIYGRRRVSADGWPMWRFVDATLPAGLADAYVVGCGVTTQVAIDAQHLSVAFQPRCSDLHVAIACTPRECWLAGTYARRVR